MQSQATRIQNSARIDRILERMCLNRTSILLRNPAQATVAVRGKTVSLDDAGLIPIIKISSVSEKGLRHLQSSERIQVEFVGISNQFIFQTRIVRVEQDILCIIKPNELLSFDRRTAVRYATSIQHTAFAEPQEQGFEKNEFGATPLFAPFEHLSQYHRVCDVSDGGMCLFSRFPSLNHQLGDRKESLAMRLHLPLRPPLEVICDVRWTRKMKETVGNPPTVEKRHYKIGVMFKDLSANSTNEIKKFIQELGMAEAL